MEDQFGGNLGDGATYEEVFERTTATAPNIKERVAEKAGEAKDKAAHLGRRAVGSIDAQREKLANAAHVTADKLQATSDYLREHDVRAMMIDVGDLVKRYPGRSLAAAAVTGFLVARVLRSHD